MNAKVAVSASALPILFICSSLNFVCQNRFPVSRAVFIGNLENAVNTHFRRLSFAVCRHLRAAISSFFSACFALLFVLFSGKNPPAPFTFDKRLLIASCVLQCNSSFMMLFLAFRAKSGFCASLEFLFTFSANLNHLFTPVRMLHVNYRLLVIFRNCSSSDRYANGIGSRNQNCDNRGAKN
uniref:Uncharacterized protein n=1 Tax=Siphoviridae sp. ctM6i4 TaxID=2827852 RepID=A0A8S5T2T2_9CAUD|nr:MAG TPA: hypothetical protein [Siphoviridae sp. ctM6i4]